MKYFIAGILMTLLFVAMSVGLSEHLIYLFISYIFGMACSAFVFLSTYAVDKIEDDIDHTNG